jgi:polysulfide reductase chain C
MGAGAYIAGVVADWLGGEWAGIAKIGVVLGFPCVLVGCAFLVADLGKPKNFWRSWMKPGTSWIARGTIVISIFMIIGAIHFGFWIWPFNSLAGADGARQAIGLLGALFALGTAIYTGILLGASRPIAFWSTAMLPLLFLVSALSTGVMAVIIAATIGGGVTEGPIMALGKADILLIIAEIFVVIFFLQATHRLPESRASAKLVLTESVAPLFWIGVAGLGLIIPLVLEIAGAFALEGGSAETAAIVASVSGVIGGLFLRQVVLAGGIHAPLKAGRFEYALART